MNNFNQLIDVIASAVKDGVICCEMDSNRVMYSPFDSDKRHVAYKHTASQIDIDRINQYCKEKKDHI